MKTNVIDIRGNSKYKLKKILIFLYLLNLSDLLFTKFLLTSAPDLFIEVNFFLNTIIDGIVLYFLKIGGMALILAYWYYRSEKSTIIQMKRSLLASKVLISVYAIINLIHIINLVIYYFFS